MKTMLCAMVGLMLCGQSMLQAENKKVIANPKIDYPGFLAGAKEVQSLREKRRVTEAEFLQMMQEPDTVLLDARSAQKYALLHIQGARNLSLPDITEAELGKIIPTKSTRVLIYCNNNFDKAPIAFASKGVTVSLNLYTFNTLHGYGYTNVYELGPFIDITTSKLPFAGKKQ
jgi:3-mercaptopyruvate sulfurtransferase SseA